MAGQWDSWIGRTIQEHDWLDPALIRCWLSTFNREHTDSEMAPQGLHFCLCLPTAATAALGEDGHPARASGDDSFLPPIALARRMWATSEIQFIAPLEIGSAIERTSTIVAITQKQGSTGPLGFVDIEHITKSAGRTAIKEKQSLVYRDAAAADAPRSPAPASDATFDAAQWDHRETVTPDPRLLFRYSALTFNTHRIHYDLPYARDAERYRGLVVHGPLIATMLMQLCAKHYGENALAAFNFRAVSPAIAGEVLHLAMRATEGGLEFGSFAADGRPTLTASGTLR